jgi:hypothetical protein
VAALRETTAMEATAATSAAAVATTTNECGLAAVGTRTCVEPAEGSGLSRCAEGKKAESKCSGNG